jgi:hypothetical protein
LGEGDTDAPQETPSPTIGTETVTVSAAADTFASASSSGTEYGSATTMRVDAVPAETGYLRFDLSNYAGRTVQSAALQVKTGSNASVVKQAIKLVSDDNWSEGGLNYDNRPPLSSTALGTVGPTDMDEVLSVPLIASVVQAQVSGDSTISLGLEQPVDDGLTLVTKEGGTPPKLVLTLSK